MTDEKPQLIVKLFAGDTLIDSSADPALWQMVLAKIRGFAPPELEPERRMKSTGGDESDDRPIARFAKYFGMNVAEVESGLFPQSQAPYITLDSRDWEALKKNTPKKGPGGVSAAVLSATALAAWKQFGDIPDVTLQAVRATLATIHLEDPNASRSINNCEWLQVRGGHITIKSSLVSSANRLLRAYCRREAPLDAV